MIAPVGRVLGCVTCLTAPESIATLTLVVSRTMFSSSVCSSSIMSCSICCSSCWISSLSVGNMWLKNLPECCVLGAPIDVAAWGFARQLVSGDFHGSPYPKVPEPLERCGRIRVAACVCNRFASAHCIPIFAISRLFFLIAARFALILSSSLSMDPNEAKELVICMPMVTT